MSKTRVARPRGLSRRTIVGLAVLALVTGLVSWPTEIRDAGAAGGAISGSVFVDYDRDGRIDTGEAVDPVLVGLSVSAHDALGGVVTALTTAGGTYSIDTSSLVGTEFRVEFGVPSGYESSFTQAFGTNVPDMGAAIRFVSAPADVGGVIHGIVPVSECPDDPAGVGAVTGNHSAGNPNDGVGKVWTTCFVQGGRDSLGTADVLVGGNYTQDGWDPSNAATDMGGSLDAEHLGVKADMGSLWGVAYDEWDGTLFTSAVVKRHGELGPRGVDGLYAIDYGDSNIDLTVQAWDLDTVPGVPGGAPSYGADPVECANDGTSYDYSTWTQAETAAGGAWDCRDVALAPTAGQSFDWWAYDRTGTHGIGDIDVTPDGNVLLVMNAAANTLFAYDITSGSPVYSAHLALNDPGCVGGPMQAWAVTAIDATRAYVGVTCTAGTGGNLADLDGHAIEVDWVAGSQTPTPVVSADLDYDHGCGWDVNCRDALTASQTARTFQPWLTPTGSPAVPRWPSETAHAVIFNDAESAWQYGVHPEYHEPLLADIEVDPFDGSLVIGVLDRMALRLGYKQCDLDPTTPVWQDPGCGNLMPAPPALDYDNADADDDPLTGVDAVRSTAPNIETLVAGDLLRACNTSGDPDAPVFALENLGDCDPTGFAPTHPWPDGGGPAGTEWYWDDVGNGQTAAPYTHPETSQAGLFIGDRRHDAVYTRSVPVRSFGAGFGWISNRDGSSLQDWQLYRTDGLDPDGTAFKGASLGDTEGCAVPTEIGDRVWLDLDGDGIQDPGEPGLEGVTVTIYADSDGDGQPDDLGSPIAQTTTSAAGAGTGAGLYQFGTADGLEPDTDYVIVVDVSTNTTTLPNGYTNTDLAETLKGVADTTAALPGEIDSDVMGGLIEVSTGPAGENDHSFDAGYTVPFDLALTKTLDPASVDADARSVTFELTVINQGRTVTDVALVDYLDVPAAGIWEDFDSAANPAGLTAPVDVDFDGSPDPGTELAWSWDDADPRLPELTLAGVLPAGAEVTVPVTLTWERVLPDGLTTLENWAEIVDFDDGDPATGTAASGDLADDDSVPDTDPADDNQPDGPGDAGDDQVDGHAYVDGVATDEDEDDHDVAGLTVPPMFDLALTKTLDDGSNLASVAPGDEVTFTITVINQGELEATEVGLVDHMPAGVTLADDAWADGGDGTATLLTPIASVAVGDSAEVNITFEVDADAQGLLDNFAEILSALGPDGEMVTDVDSTPDDQNDDLFTTDDEIGEDGLGGGDEDDHDRAQLTVGDTYSLGNQVWLDLDGDGLMGAGESPLPNIWVELFADADGDGQPDDLDADGDIDADDMLAMDTTDADGLYLFAGLPAGGYVVVIPAIEFEVGEPLEGFASSVPTSNDPEDGVDGDDNGIVDETTGWVISGPIELGSDSPLGEDPDNDAATPDANEDLTIDFGFVPPIDLSLAKSTSATTVAPGGQITWTLLASNVGAYTAIGPITVVDVLPAGLTFVSAGGEGWECAHEVQIVTCVTGDAIEPGAVAATISVVTSVSGEIGASIENDASVRPAPGQEPSEREVLNNTAIATVSLGTPAAATPTPVATPAGAPPAQVPATPGTLPQTGGETLPLLNLALVALGLGLLASAVRGEWQRGR